MRIKSKNLKVLNKNKQIPILYAVNFLFIYFNMLKDKSFLIQATANFKKKKKI